MICIFTYSYMYMPIQRYLFSFIAIPSIPGTCECPLCLALTPSKNKVFSRPRKNHHLENRCCSASCFIGTGAQLQPGFLGKKTGFEQ